MAMFLKTLFILTFIAILNQNTVSADYYQYTDSSGTVVMVDDESKVPAKYRKKIFGEKNEGKASKVTSVTVRNNQVRVPVRLSYRNNVVEAQMVLDTGATTTMITSDLADRLGIRADSTEAALARIADGSLVQSSWTRLDYISVGSRRVHNPKVAIMPSRGPLSGFGDGLLGMNFLGEFRYHVDMNSQIIEWQ
jgi:clan AA aspartic protease (TIGR02281 family)